VVVVVVVVVVFVVVFVFMFVVVVVGVVLAVRVVGVGVGRVVLVRVLDALSDGASSYACLLATDEILSRCHASFI
jgi:hypothetical protein